VLPDRPLFSRDKVDASASIVLKVRGRLAAGQVRAIRHLVASAVNGLKPDRISVVDEMGRLLADGAGSDNPFAAGNADERQLAYENRLRQQVESIVDSVVGPGHARVQVNAEFDLNRVTETSDKYDPDSRVVRSSQTREESSSNGGSGGPVSVSNELPGAGPDTANGGGASRNGDHKTEETVNYEISRTTKTEVTEAGRLKRVSAAVLVDVVYSKDAKGNMVYQPRSKEEIDRIAALVRTAIGFDSKRGDQIEVANLRFAEPAPQPIEQPTGWLAYFHFTKDDIMSGAEMGVMALLGILVMFMVVRPLVRRIVTPDESLAPRGTRGGVALGPGGILIDARGQPLTDAKGNPIIPTGGMTINGTGGGSITAGAGPNVSLVGADEQVNISNRTSAMIDIAKVQGQVHAQSVEKVGELAEKNPHEAVSIIRSWLHEEAA
jgi:flagellar M-ring protein FliF